MLWGGVKVLDCGTPSEFVEEDTVLCLLRTGGLCGGELVDCDCALGLLGGDSIIGSDSITIRSDGGGTASATVITGIGS